jgi:hypothetical protein
MYGGVGMFMICLCIKFHANNSCGPLSVTIKPVDTDMRTEAILFNALQQYYLARSYIFFQHQSGIKKASGFIFSATSYSSASAMLFLQL